MQLYINSRQKFDWTDQGRHTSVAVDQRQSRQTDDDITQSRCEESRESTISVMTQGQHTLQAFNQLCHDLTGSPLKSVWNSQYCPWDSWKKVIIKKKYIYKFPPKNV